MEMILNTYNAAIEETIFDEPHLPRAGITNFSGFAGVVGDE
jgi:hypothetical protein